MGNSSETTTPLSQKQKENFKTLKGIEEDVRITYKAHFQSSSYYEPWTRALDFFTYYLMPPSSAIAICIARQTPASKFNVIALGVLGLIGSTMAKFAESPYHPKNQQESHFEAGIKLSTLHKEIQAFRELSVHDNNADMKKFMDEFRRIIKTKEECDKIIQSKAWAFERAKEYDRYVKSLDKTMKENNDERKA